MTLSEDLRLLAFLSSFFLGFSERGFRESGLELAVQLRVVLVTDTLLCTYNACFAALQLTQDDNFSIKF